MENFTILNNEWLPDICSILKRSFNVYRGINIDVQYFWRLFESDPGIRNGVMYGIVVDDHLASFLQVVDRKLSMHPLSLRVAGIANVATDPDFRGRGYASKLLNNALKDLANKGYALASLFAGYGEPAHRIYRRYGFIDIVTYSNRVCIDEDLKLIERQINHHFSQTRSTFVNDYKEIKEAEQLENHIVLLKELYQREIVEKYRASVIRDDERWAGILRWNPFKTWFLSEIVEGSIIVEEEHAGYYMVHPVSKSILRKLMDPKTCFLSELVASNKCSRLFLVKHFIERTMKTGCKTVIARTTGKLDSIFEPCPRIGTNETFMVKIINYDGFYDFLSEFLDANKHIMNHPIKRLIIHVNGKRSYSIIIGENIEIASKPPEKYDVLINETGLLRLLFSSSTATREYKKDNIIVKNGLHGETLKFLDLLLRSRKSHYISLIDIW